MANGLRKLIKRARKQYINNSNLNRRFNRFGSRLKVEELEERIAPAFVPVSFDGDATDDTIVTDGTGNYAEETSTVAFIGNWH